MKATGKKRFEQVAKAAGNNQPLISSMSTQDVTGQYGALMGAVFGNRYKMARYIPTQRLQRLSIYRQMSQYPLIAKILNMMAAELSAHGGFLFSANSSLPVRFYEGLKQNWDILVNKGLKITDTLYHLFYALIRDGEVFCELLTSADGTGGIRGWRLIPAETIAPVYDLTTNTLLGFTRSIYSDNIMTQGISTISPNLTVGGQSVDWLPNQIFYCNTGIYGDNINDVRSILDNVYSSWQFAVGIITALSAYRLSRASFQRVWKFDAPASLPEGKAEAYLTQATQTIHRKPYATDDGTIDETAVSDSVVSDYTFLQYPNQKVTVDTLTAPMEVGGLKDLEYHDNNIIMGMGIPRRRIKDENYVYKSKDGINYDELSWFRDLSRYGKNFATGLRNVQTTHLLMKGYPTRYATKFQVSSLIEAEILRIEFSNFEHKIDIISQLEPLMEKGVLDMEKIKEMILLPWAEGAFKKKEQPPKKKGAEEEESVDDILSENNRLSVNAKRFADIFNKSPQLMNYALGVGNGVNISGVEDKVSKFLKKVL